MPHLHWIVWAAQDKQRGPTGDNYIGITYVDVLAESMEEAVKRAKKLVPGRNHYWLNNCVEHHDDHGQERR